MRPPLRIPSSLLPLLAALVVAVPVQAQAAPTATLTGVVVDSAGTGVAEATVVVEPGDPLAARDSTRARPRGVTDATGRFRIEGVPAGAIVLVVEHPRYKSVEAAADVAAGVTVSLRITLTEVPPPEPQPEAPSEPAGPARWRGIVTDTGGRPIADADVGPVDATVAVRTDSAGRFALPVGDASTTVLRARRLGYRAAYVTRQAGDTATVTFVLQPVGQQLGTVRVRATWDNRSLVEMQRRRMLHGGVHILRDEIEQRGAFRVTDVLQGRMGITVRRGSFGNGIVLGRLDCRMGLVLNGIPVQGASIDDVVNATDVVAIEAYNSASNTPAEFRGLRNDTCGVVAVWTK